jgi:adenylylsulfate kinase-like enzyme
MGWVFWITGLPGSGKTSISVKLKNYLEDRNVNCIILDGDDLRKVLDNRDYSRSSRIDIAKTYSRLARYLANQGFNIVIATVSLFHEVHCLNRLTIENYCEVFLDFSQDKLIEGPRKNLYLDLNAEGYTTAIVPEYPLDPDIILKASNDIERQKWFDKLIQHKIIIELTSGQIE